MATRTSSAAVQAILGQNYDGTTVLTPFIETATALVDWLSSKDSNGELTSTLLELIERYLSAHFYHPVNQFVQAEGAEGASNTYQGQTGLGLNSTMYGQTALRLDVTGILSKRELESQQGKRKATVAWLGKTESEQISYEDRMG